MLPKNEHSFNVDVKGETTGERFQGSFTVKQILTVREQAQVGLLADTYNGGSRTIPRNVALMNLAIAELEVRIMQDKKGAQLAPSWWRDSDDGRDLLDVNVLYDIYNQALLAEKAYKTRVSGEAQEAEDAAKASVEAKDQASVAQS